MLRSKIFTLLVVIGLVLPCVVVWAQLGPSYVDMTRQQFLVPSQHDVHFSTTNGLLVPDDTISITFASGFDLSHLIFSDIALSFGPVTGSETTAVVAGAPTNVSWGVVVSGQTVILTRPTSGVGLPAGSEVIVSIGVTNQVVNPATTGSYILSIALSNGEHKKLAVPINDGDGVGVSAVTTGVSQVVIQWAVPEMRVGPPGTNDGSTFYLTVRQPDPNGTVLYTQPDLLTTNEDGTYTIPISLPVGPGLYGIGIKTSQHLTRKLSGVSLTSGITNLNFTNLMNDVARGVITLVAGDISGAGDTPATLGDDVVNSVDLSNLVTRINDVDPTAHAIRADLNRDTEVNSVDLSLMISNLDKEGDK